MSRRMPAEHLIAAATVEESSGQAGISTPNNSAVAAATRVDRSDGLVIRKLIAIADEGCTPLVLYPDQPGTAAIRARALVDLHGAHVFGAAGHGPCLKAHRRDRVRRHQVEPIRSLKLGSAMTVRRSWICLRSRSSSSSS
jgi:hypothetical protein